MDSIEARHAREQAEQRRQSRELIADTGPHLADDDATVVIPSPARHPVFKRILLAYGFRYEHGLMPWWERPTDEPHAGRAYAPDGWLRWARSHYAKAWPKWDGGRVN